MKELQMEDSALYSDVKASLVTASASNMFFMDYVAEVFTPEKDDDDRENVDW
ncbi:hypothetical protein D3C77_807960 [compost metagenome]